MKNLINRIQIVFVSVILFATFALMMGIVSRFNYRWDFTSEKAYTLSDPTIQLLKDMRNDKIRLLAFYPQNDPSRKNLEIFMKQAAMHHPRFEYQFYDPDRVPKLTKEYQVSELYTIILEYSGRQERVIQPAEEGFANALLKLSSPEEINICFVTGHGEASAFHDDQAGYSRFREVLEINNYVAKEIILSRDKVPDACSIVAVPGPHRELNPEDFDELMKAFQSGKGVFFLIDPMDSGAGETFRRFFLKAGIFLGSDVVVDKMGKMVGGDFLIPLVSQYVSVHPVTKEFKLPSFFPVARSVQPSSETIPGIEAIPLAFTGSGSWAESNLDALENGEANFDAESDLSGPLSIAVASEIQGGEGQKGGRLIVVGDSDFLNNTYLDLAGNRKLAMNMVLWLSQDNRSVVIEPRRHEYKPLFITETQKMGLFMTAVVGMPMFFLVAGMVTVIYRQRTS